MLGERRCMLGGCMSGQLILARVLGESLSFFLLCFLEFWVRDFLVLCDVRVPFGVTDA